MCRRIVPAAPPERSTFRSGIKFRAHRHQSSAFFRYAKRVSIVRPVLLSASTAIANRSSCPGRLPVRTAESTRISPSSPNRPDPFFVCAVAVADAKEKKVSDELHRFSGMTGLNGTEKNDENRQPKHRDRLGEDNGDFPDAGEGHIGDEIAIPP